MGGEQDLGDWKAYWERDTHRHTQSWQEEESAEQNGCGGDTRVK